MAPELLLKVIALLLFWGGIVIAVLLKAVGIYKVFHIIFY